MNEDLQELIDNALNKEKELQVRSEELALQDKRFADYLQAKKHADEELEVLWGMVKDYMIDNNYTEYDGEHIELKLTPSGKYRAEDIESDHELPEGVESTGYVLRKKVK